MYKILLAEDDNDMRRFLAKALEKAGYEVTAYDNGGSAYERLREEPFSLLLSDIVMPGGMTGIELAQQVTRDYPAMKVVLTSGYAGDDVDEALKDAPWPFLRKPYSGEELASILGGSEDTTQS